jgi:hypothetical protein
LQVFLPLLDVSEFYRRKNSLRHEKSKRLSKVWENWHKKTGIVNDVYFMISLYILQYFACTFFTYTLVQAFTFDCRFVEALKFAEALKKVYFCIFFLLKSLWKELCRLCKYAVNAFFSAVACSGHKIANNVFLAFTPLPLASPPIRRD